MELGAHVLLPHGFDEHPEARYPLMIFHGHFPSDFGGFRTEPPDPDLECELLRALPGRLLQPHPAAGGLRLLPAVVSPDFPRFLVIEIQHPTPYYDDSYAVNSANLGPYGDAITHELIPFIEERFRGIGEGWARFLYGGSTGGWEALAAQVFYPDEYNGAFAACPDPIDFRAYMTVNIYDDANAYFDEGPFRQRRAPSHRDWLGASPPPCATTHWSSCWARRTAPATSRHLGGGLLARGRGRLPAADLGQAHRRHRPRGGGPLARELRPAPHPRARLGRARPPKLAGKIHILRRRHGQLLPQQRRLPHGGFLESTTDPYYAGEVDYGDRAEHCWNGDHENPNHISRLRYNTMYLERILEAHRSHRAAGPHELGRATSESWRSGLSGPRWT
jgi:hypothetical protein